MEEKINKSVVNTFKILDLINKKNGKIGISEISRETNIPKATTFRIVSTLLSLKILEDDKVQNLSLGYKFLDYVKNMRSDNDLLYLCMPEMKKFVSEIGETINLGILHDDQVIYVHSEQGENFNIQIRLLPYAPLYSSSIGKLFLSQFSDQELKEYFDKINIQKDTVNTKTDIKSLLPDLKEVRNTHFAYDDEEFEYGLSCIAVPILKNGKIIAGLSVSGPTSRLKVKGIEKIKEKLKETAKEINKKCK